MRLIDATPESEHPGEEINHSRATKHAQTVLFFFLFIEEMGNENNTS
jgi:hypothetical protein